VRACFDGDCSAYRTGSNGVTVITLATLAAGDPGPQSVDPGLCKRPGHPDHDARQPERPSGHRPQFLESCALAGAVIESGAQGVRWTNSNFYLADCEPGFDQQCSASYVIRNSSTGQLHSGTASITVVAQGQSLQPGQYCP
jgi:hypothetical protein